MIKREEHELRISRLDVDMHIVRERLVAMDASLTSLLSRITAITDLCSKPSRLERLEKAHAQLSRQVHNISAFTPDRSPNLGLVRVLERAIKEAKADLKPSDWE